MVYACIFFEIFSSSKKEKMERRESRKRVRRKIKIYEQEEKKYAHIWVCTCVTFPLRIFFKAPLYCNKEKEYSKTFSHYLELELQWHVSELLAQDRVPEEKTVVGTNTNKDEKCEVVCSSTPRLPQRSTGRERRTTIDSGLWCC